jgi:pSer/pThr/pTyr-binding forkhead associated (FHA) protein/DNA-binding CsgD family transcriptional regulator
VPDRPSWPTDPRDRIRVREAEAAGDPFLIYRDDSGTQRIVALGGERALAVMGRAPTSDIPIVWDDRVSRTHARLERIGPEWSIEDDGLSRNGTYVNEERVRGRRHLRDGDVVRAGHTTLVFRTPPSGASRATEPESRLAPPPTLSDAQRRVLDALCRPCVGESGPLTPATNEQIAAELHLSVDAVKAHLRQLFRRFEVEDLPQIQKRTALVRLALAAGLVRGPR